MKLLFLDESGNHALESVDPQYPVFVLGGIIVDRTYYRTVMEPRIRAFKQDFFGNPELIIHTLDIARRQNGFESLADRPTLTRFYEQMNALMAELEYKVVACAIKKDAYVSKYGARAVDPYHYSLEVVVERFCHEIGDTQHGGIIVAEKRRTDLDEELDRTWRGFCAEGTEFMDRHKVDGRIIDLSLKNKKLNIAGLQLADLVVSPIGRYVIGRRTRADWAIVETKFRRRGDIYKGAGLVVLP